MDKMYSKLFPLIWQFSLIPTKWFLWEDKVNLYWRAYAIKLTLEYDCFDLIVS